jgi:hypothetical protein
MRQVTPFCVAFSLATKHGFIIVNLRADTRMWNGNTRRSPSNKFKFQSVAINVTFTLFWDSEGPVLENCEEWGVAMNNANYSEMLGDKLKLAIQSEHPG